MEGVWLQQLQHKCIPLSRTTACTFSRTSGIEDRRMKRKKAGEAAAAAAAPDDDEDDDAEEALVGELL